MIEVPQHVAENLKREQLVDSLLRVAREWSKILRERDRELSIVFAMERAQDPRLVPGRFHVKRDNSAHGIPDAYMAITGPNGEFREPDSGVLDEIGRRDMWRSGNGVEAALRAQQRRDAESAYRAEQTRGEARETAELMIRARDNTSIRVPK